MFAVRHPRVLIHRFKNVWVLSNRKSLWRLWKTQKNTKKREKISSDAPALRQALPSFPAKQPPHFSQCQKTDATPHPERKAWGTISPAGLQVPGPPWRPASHRQLTWPQGLCNPNRQSLHQTRSLPPRRWAQPAPSAGFRVSRLSGEGLSPGGPALGASPRPRPVCVLVSSPGCCSRAGGRGSLHPNAEPGGSSGAPCRPRPGLPPWPGTAALARDSGPRSCRDSCAPGLRGDFAPPPCFGLTNPKRALLTLDPASDSTGQGPQLCVRKAPCTPGQQALLSAWPPSRSGAPPAQDPAAASDPAAATCQPSLFASPDSRPIPGSPTLSSWPPSRPSPGQAQEPRTRLSLHSPSSAAGIAARVLEQGAGQPPPAQAGRLPSWTTGCPSLLLTWSSSPR